MTASKESGNAFEYLWNRFLKKKGWYIDTTQEDLPQYRTDDLLTVLWTLGYSKEEVKKATQDLSTRGVRVWSSKTVFVPGEGRIIDGDGMADINAWKQPTTVPEEGDVGPFLHYLERLVPTASDREWLLNFLAHRYQHPAVKPKHGVILYGKRQGTGKSTLGTIVERVFGNTKKVTTVDGLVGRFSAPNWSSSWVVAEEIKVTAGGTTYNALKDLVTGESKQGERKGQDFASFQTPAALLLFSNYEPSFIEPDDRRFFIVEVDSDDSREELHSYFAGFHQWLESGGYSYIAAFLQKHDTGSYSPTAAPPMTEAKKRLVGLVKTGLSQEVADWLDDLGRNVVAEDELEGKFERTSLEQMRHLLSEAGWEKFDGRVTVLGRKRRLWHRQGTEIDAASGKKARLVDLDGSSEPLEDLLGKTQCACENCL